MAAEKWSVEPALCSGANYIAIGNDPLDPSFGVHEEVKLSGGGRGVPAGIGRRNLRMALSNGVASAEFRIKLNGNFVGGQISLPPWRKFAGASKSTMRSLRRISMLPPVAVTGSPPLLSEAAKSNCTL